jgi:hypothetical protein
LVGGAEVYQICPGLVVVVVVVVVVAAAAAAVVVVNRNEGFLDGL